MAVVELKFMIAGILSLTVCWCLLMRDVGTVSLLVGIRQTPLVFLLLAVDVFFAIVLTLATDQVLSNPVVWATTGGSVPVLLGSKRLSIESRRIDVNLHVPYVIIVPLLRDKLGQVVARVRRDRARRLAEQLRTLGVNSRQLHRALREDVAANSLALERTRDDRCERLDGVMEGAGDNRSKLFTLVDLAYQWGMVSTVTQQMG